MKLILPSVLATCLLTPLCESTTRSASLAQDSPAASPPASADANPNDFKYYIGRQERWLVDLRLGVVSAWELERDAPLWSRDGVVFRVAQRPNDVFSDFKVASMQTPEPVVEIFGRVYFFLNDALVALDPRAHGRLVWKRNVDDFARFFAAPSSASPLQDEVDDASLSLTPKILPLSKDRLLIQARRDRDAKFFIVDAASGEFRLALPDETPGI